MATDDAGAQVAAVEAALLARLRNCDRFPHVAVRTAAQRVAVAPSQASARALSEELGLSTRRVQQIFRSDVGLTPQQYRRLQRFRRAARDIDRAAQVGFAGFALECGYYDQSHFANEFRACAGVTPGQFLRLRGAHPNHIAVSD